MSITTLSIKDRLDIAQKIGEREGQKDGQHDVERYSEETARMLLLKTAMVVAKKLAEIDAQLKSEAVNAGKGDWEIYDQSLANELQENTYLSSYVRAWGKAQAAKD